MIKRSKVLCRNNRFQELSLQKPEAYLEPKQASTIELFVKILFLLTIFAIKVPSYMVDWVIYRPPKILKFSKSS